MKNKKIRLAGIWILVAVWLGLTAGAWLRPADAASQTERRPLTQFPELSASAMLSGEFTERFEEYTLDQFPLRETFRSAKALFHRYGLWQKDNNGIYIEDGCAAQLEYPLNEASVDHALRQFDRIYKENLQNSGCTVFAAVVPDKGYYLAESNGYPSMDYSRLFSAVREGMPWATHIDLTDCLSAEDYYRTDTHWRQERLFPVAQKLAAAMGVALPRPDDFTATAVEQPFYGVYYGQAALPLKPDSMQLLKNDRLDACRVYNQEKGSYAPVYDLDKLQGNDLYEVYLSGPQSLLTIENPSAGTDRELIVFRDSFGSSLVPLLTEDYARVTLVDIRYINAAFLERYIDFNGQDVLFLYSTLVLNSNAI